MPSALRPAGQLRYVGSGSAEVSAPGGSGGGSPGRGIAHGSGAPQSATGIVPPVVGLTAGLSVAVWSESKKQWYNDGTISEVTEQFLFVRFDAGTMGKWIPAEQSQKVLRPLHCASPEV